jgi:hypothetical protein
MISLGIPFIEWWCAAWELTDLFALSINGVTVSRAITPKVTVTVAITPKLHQTQLCLASYGESYGDTCNNPQTSPDAVALGGRAHGRRGSAGSGSGWTLNYCALNPVPEWQGQIGRPGLIGDERVTSHLLSPPPLKPDQRVQGKVRNLEHSVATELSGGYGDTWGLR